MRLNLLGLLIALAPFVALAQPIPAPYVAPLLQVNQRPPLSTDDTTQGHLVGDDWAIPGDQRIWTAAQIAANYAVWSPVSLAQPYPVDAVGGTIPVACYGTKKLRAAYTGSLVNVENPTALVPTDIGFLADGSIDSRALFAVAGSAGYVDVDGWYDQCGSTVSFNGSISGTTLTLSATATLPVGSVITGTNATSFGGVTLGTTVVSGSGTSYVITPSQTEATVEPMIASNLGYQATVANMPTMTPPDTLGNSYPVIFDGHVYGTTASKFMNIPTSVAFATTIPVSAVSVSQAEGNQSDDPIFSLIDTTNAGLPLGFGNFSGSASFGVLMNSNVINASVAPSLTPFVSGFVANGTTPASFSWLDSHSITGSTTRGSLALAGGYLGKYVTSTYGAYSEQSELLIYNRALSTTDEATANAVNYRYFGLTPQTDGCLIFNGDSITQGELTTLGQFYAAQVKPLLAHTGFRVFNLSTYGTSSSQQKKLLATAIPTEYSNCVGYTNKVQTEFTGTNDIANQPVITAYQSGTTLNIVTIANPVGTGVNQVITGTGFPAGETIVSQQSGTLDGVGVYTMSASATNGSSGSPVSATATATAASIYYNDQQIAAQAHANGFKFVLIDMLPRTGFIGTTNAAGTNEDAIRTAYNTLVTTNSGGFEDGWVDVASDPTMGLQSSLTNTLYYANGGGVHPGNYGDAYLAQAIATEINTLFPH